MIYGNLRSLYSPAGKEYVTRWNPMAQALAGSPPSLLQAPQSGEFGSGRSSGAGSQNDGGGRDGDSGPREGGAPRGGSFGSPFGGMSHGRAGGMIGAGLGLGFGIPGAGMLGNAIGTGIDVSRANAALDTTRANNPQLSAPPLGVKDFLSGFVNNATFGLAGTPVSDSMISSALTGVDMPGVPNQSQEPDSIAAAQSSSGDWGGGGGHASDSYGGGTGDPSGSGAPFYRGGHVTPEKLGGPNPPGPDDGHATLDIGEFVLRASAARKLGPDILEKLNSGDFRKAALIKALSGK